LIVQLITNSTGITVCSDQILRFFLDWIETYHQSHFALVQVVHRNQGPTRRGIWVAVHGEAIPRDDSAEAEIYTMLIKDLIAGGVMRQVKASDASGQFWKSTADTARFPYSGVVESPFEDTKQYVLTGLGKQFVHYTMNELVSRLEGA
jgi:hypothetical protein